MRHPGISAVNIPLIIMQFQAVLDGKIDQADERGDELFFFVYKKSEELDYNGV